MGELQAFVQKEYPLVKAQLAGLESLLMEIWSGLTGLQKEVKGDWDYFVGSEAPLGLPAGQTSSSTRAMIGYGLATYIGKSAHLRTKSHRAIGLAKDFEAALDRCKTGIKVDSKEPNYATSSSFGKNNPFTLLWSHLLCGKGGLSTECVALIDEQLKQWGDHRGEKSLEFIGAQSTTKATSHSFISLTWLHLHKSREEDESANVKLVLPNSLAVVFKSRVDEQIAHFHLNDGLFDAGDLVFSLEGYLLSGLPHPFIDEKLLCSVIDCLSQAQSKSPYWRPLKPITVLPSGQILLPLSIEIVNSLTRICDLLDSGKEPFHFFKKAKPLFLIYYDWLRSRLQRGTTAGGKMYCGWASEHTYDNKGIHTWETSQVAVFLQSYRALLQQDLSSHLLSISGLVHRKIEKPEYELTERPLAEPVSELGCFNSIFRHFIEPRKREKTAEIKASAVSKPSWSMLLYGPPGTGKTTLCSCLAAALDWTFIQLSPSDFIAEGESLVEARAESIFTVLKEQFKSVILLDEIDRLILDRSSEAYSKQNDFFQFMTPSMLVKINDLRKLERSIFIINTNYEERIDSAIKRQGRIDHKYLILTSDLVSRQRILNEKLAGRPAGEIEDLAKKLALMNYSELKTVASDVLASSPTPASKVPFDPPTIALKDYRSRFLDAKDRMPDQLKGCPVAEFLWLVALQLESDAAAVASRDKTLITEVLSKIVSEKAEPVGELENHRVPAPRAVVELLSKHGYLST